MPNQQQRQDPATSDFRSEYKLNLRAGQVEEIKKLQRAHDKLPAGTASTLSQLNSSIEKRTPQWLDRNGEVLQASQFPQGADPSLPVVQRYNYLRDRELETLGKLVGDVESYNAIVNDHPTAVSTVNRTQQAMVAAISNNKLPPELVYNITNQTRLPSNQNLPDGAVESWNQRNSRNQ